MLKLEGRKVQLHYTGQEAPQVFPINNGKPMNAALVTFYGEVKHETPQGIWFQLERLWADGVELHGAPIKAHPTYFVAWSRFLRPVLHEPAVGPQPGPPGQYL